MEFKQDEKEIIIYNKVKDRPKDKFKYFEIYILKVLKQYSNNSINLNAKQQLSSFICIIADKISAIALKLTELSNKKTILDKEIFNALKIILSGELLENCIIDTQKAIEKFSSNLKIKGSRQYKCGLILSPSICEQFLRNFGYSKIMISINTPIILASILEYIVIEILILASKLAIKYKRVRITIKDLQLSINNDPELFTFFKKLNIILLAGSSIEHINPLCNKKLKNKTHNTTLKKINKASVLSETCLMFSKCAFEKIVRDIVNIQNPDMKISRNIFIILQYYIEQYIISILKDSYKASSHANRNKLMVSDINLICQIKNIPIEELDKPL